MSTATNTKMMFYNRLLHYLQNGHMKNVEAGDIIQASFEPELSWIPTDDDLRHLEYIKKRNKGIGKKWDDSRMLRILAYAFIDLAPIRNPNAMEIWHDLSKEVTNGLVTVHVIWADPSKTKVRKEGSKVLRVYTSHENSLRLLGKHKGTKPEETPEQGIVFVT